MQKKISFITSNSDKFEEIKEKMASNEKIFRKYRFIHLKQQYTELQAETIKQVALASATDLTTIISNDFLIEDSGISITALNDFPGPYSSYVYKTIGWDGILRLMQNIEKREAYFSSVFVLSLNGTLFTFEGKITGKIAKQGRGSGGFGFDPIFLPDSSKEDKSLAEMTMSEKNRISHRADSMNRLIKFLEEYEN